jgi:putative photosynthetic complex assembly protein
MSQFQQALPRVENRPFIGRVPLIMVLSLVLGTLFIVSVASLTGLGVVRMPASEILAYRDLLVIDGKDGKGLIRDAADNSLVVEFQPGQMGFARMVIRGMAQDRLKLGGSPDVPFRLSRHADGHLILTDPLSGNRRVIDSFGSINVTSFQQLMTMGK